MSIKQKSSNKKTTNYPHLDIGEPQCLKSTGSWRSRSHHQGFRQDLLSGDCRLVAGRVWGLHGKNRGVLAAGHSLHSESSKAMVLGEGT